MSWLKTFATSSIGKKVFTGLTGLFLCLFLIGHLAGNLQLFVGGEEGQLAFNEYALFMTTNPLVKVMSYLTYACILGHALLGIMLTIQNKKARPVNYAVYKGNKNSIWSSRNMGILGVMLLSFIILHMYGFWAKMHFSEMPLDAAGNKDIHSIVASAFKAEWYVALYVFLMIPIGFHLYHGFQSGFQSLGFNHNKYTPVIKMAGQVLFGVIIPALFAIIPIWCYLFIDPVTPYDFSF